MAGFSEQRRYVCLGFDRRKESLRKLNTPRSFEKKNHREWVEVSKDPTLQGFSEQVAMKKRGWGGGQIQVLFHCLLMKMSNFVSIPWESGWYRKLWIKGDPVGRCCTDLGLAF